MLNIVRWSQFVAPLKSGLSVKKPQFSMGSNFHFAPEKNKLFMLLTISPYAMVHYSQHNGDAIVLYIEVTLCTAI